MDVRKKYLETCKRSAFTLAEGGQSPLFNLRITASSHRLLLCATKGTQGSSRLTKVAFTLAEVLITLGIIGVVAAMTLPTLIQNYKNREVESKLQKIYTVMNQAIMMSEITNGPKEYWNNTCTADDNGKRLDDCKENFEKYFLKYLKYLKTEEIESPGGLYNIVIYMNDGSLLVAKYNTNDNNKVDFKYYPNAKNFSITSYSGTDENGWLTRPDVGTVSFSFFFAPSCNTGDCKYHYKKGFEPYAWRVNEYTKEELTETGFRNYTCNINSTLKNYCTAIIRLNGWKIPKDYPFKVK